MSENIQNSQSSDSVQKIKEFAEAAINYHTSSDYGIDYGGGMVNLDRENGIRFGVIPMNSLHEWAHEDFQEDYGDPTCGRCGNELVEYDNEKHGEYDSPQYGCSDYACESCERVYDSSECYSDESLGSVLDDGEYKASCDIYGDVFITKSPYYTYARYCSPCAPGACHLSHPVNQWGPVCYCFDHSWFPEGKAPYRVFRVVDDTEVMPGEK